MKKPLGEINWELEDVGSFLESGREKNFVTPITGVLKNHINASMNAEKHLLVQFRKKLPPHSLSDKAPFGYLIRRVAEFLAPS